MFEKNVKKLDKMPNIVENNEFFKLAESCDHASKSSSINIPPNDSSSKENASFKYKPDWICSDKNCQNLNFARRTHCNMCGLKRTDDAELDYSSKNHPDREFLNIKRNKTSLKPGEWFCPNCNILNFSVRTVCVRCFTDKPVGNDKNTESRGSRKSKYHESKESKKNKERRVVKRSQSKEMKPLKDDMNHKRKNSGRSYHDDSSENSQKYEKKRRDNDLDKSNNITQQTQYNNLNAEVNNTSVNYQFSQGQSALQQPGNNNFVENLFNLAVSIGNMNRNNSVLNNVNVNQHNISQQNVFCPNYNQGSNIQLHSLVQSFLYIMSQKMEQRAFFEFSNTFINLINQFIMNGTVSN